MRKFGLILWVAALSSCPAWSQSELSLYRLSESLPQANMLNPAFFPHHKVVIGLPIVSGIYLNANNDGIAFNDMFIRDASENLVLDTLGLPDKFRKSHRLRFNDQIQLFYFGLRGKKSYFTFGIHQVSEARFSFPGLLASWAIRGPADPRNAGNTFDFSDFYSRAMLYNQISVSYGREVMPDLRVGLRVKYLLGVAAGQTSQIGGSLHVGIDSVSIRTQDLVSQAAGVDFFDQNNLTTRDYVQYFLKPGNSGIAIDLGGQYQVTDRLSVSAALNDLGSITWKNYVNTYQIDAINYTFRGFDLLDYFNNSNQSSLSQEADSLENLFNASETAGGQFKTSLIGKFYAGVNYRVLKVNNFSAQFYFDLFRKEFNPALSIGYTLQLGRILSATIGATYQDSKINNIGGGLALKLGGNQFYATSDRVNSLYYPARAPRADVHAGMNLVFGRPNKDKKKKEKEEEPEPEVKPEPVPTPVDSVVQETPEEEVPAPDTAVVESVSVVEVDTLSQAEVAPALPQDTARVVETVMEDTVQSVPVVEPTPVEPDHQTFKRGNNADEFALGHFVIVGAFGVKANAEAYVRLLKREGYNARFSFLTEKLLYYIYTYETTNLDAARAERDRLRQINQFQFPSAWVLTVER
ncbi:MAG: DUF5723 family protein [Cyclobacteriaceae bacterium]